MKHRRATTTTKTFAKDELLQCIQHTNADSPVFYATGYDNMLQFVSKKENLCKIASFLNENRSAPKLIFVIFNPKMKRYYIEKMGMRDMVAESVYMNNKNDHLVDIVRFLNKTVSLEDAKDCQICFDSLPQKYSETMFNLLTYTCERCFNSTCVSCYIKSQHAIASANNRYGYTCPFCKLSKSVCNTESIYILNRKDCVIERDEYNKKMMEIDAVSKETEDESEVRACFQEWLMSIRES